jgi:hypothetical protein
VIRELRERGVHVWVDIENLIPGSPAWETEIERAIRGEAGIIVLLSPDSNNSEWVRREISFAEQNRKRIFPVLIRGDEYDSIPLRLSSHQRVDLRRNFGTGLDELARARKEHLCATAVHRIPRQKNPIQIDPAVVRRLLLIGLLAMVGIACLGGLAWTANYVYRSISQQPSRVVTTQPVISETTANIVSQDSEPIGRIVYTCQVEGDEVCIIHADGSGLRTPPWQVTTHLFPRTASRSSL